jgi:hypothetical protein
MNRSGWSARLARAALALSIVSAGGAIATERVEKGPITRTPAVQNGQDGMWVEYTEYVYLYAPLIQKALDLYKEILGVQLTENDLAGIRAKLENGTLTLDQLRKQLLEAKSLLAYNPDPVAEWHSRDFDLNKLRAAFGNSGGWIDGLPGNATMASLAGSSYWHGGGDGMSIIGQSTRLLRLAELMESGVLPGNTFDIKGIFTHYASSAFNTTTPYYSPLNATNVYGTNHGNGSYSHIYSLGSTEADVYRWYAEYWGYGLQIDIQDATAAKLREAAQLIYKSAISTGSPIALDLNGNNRIGTTGRSTAQVRHDQNTFVREGSVLFDLFALGKPVRTEWMNTENDALLVDDRTGEVTKAARTNGVISGKFLFGNAGGFDNGYAKLALILREQNRLASTSKNFKAMVTLKGSGLNGLKAWVDSNRDAKVQPGELHTLESLGITELEVFPKKVKNSFGETLIQSYYVEKGKRKLAEDVWFALDPSEQD